MTEHEWKEPIKILDGKHTGEIVRVEEDHDPYEYTNVVVKLDDFDLEIRYGCPTTLSENTKLGKLLQVFGVSAAPGTKTDPEKVLKGKPCEFMTMMKKSKKDGIEYAEIVADSLKPKTSEEKTS